MIKGLGVLQRDVSVRYDKLVDVSGLYSHIDLHRLLSTKPLVNERNRGIFTTAVVAFGRTHDMITRVLTGVVQEYAEAQQTWRSNVRYDCCLVGGKRCVLGLT